jgi:hypothetical protein
MHKRQINYYFSKLKKLPKWLFLGLGLFFVVICIFSLRANNFKMLELKQAVFVADEQDGDIETALFDLREYVYAHMNTNISSGDNPIKPPIQLKYEYERLVAKEKAKTEIANDKVYTDAQTYCEQKIPTGFSGRVRIECIQSYVDANGQKVAQADSIPEAAYKFDFASPSWSPDLAGWSLVLAIVFIGLFTALLLLELVFKYIFLAK